MPILRQAERFGELTIRCAVPGEENVLLDVLSEAACRLNGRGIAQWPRRFPVDSVRARIATGEALLVEDLAGPVATFVVRPRDAELWGVEEESAYHLSRFAIVSRATGVGLGYRLINWIDDLAARHDRLYLRLATSRDNPALRRYYEHAGFRHVTDPPHVPWPTSLYQRRVRRSRPRDSGRLLPGQ